MTQEEVTFLTTPSTPSTSKRVSKGVAIGVFVAGLGLLIHDQVRKVVKGRDRKGPATQA